MDFPIPRVQPRLGTTMTAAHKEVLIANLRLELENRINKLRTHEQLLAKSVKSKIEMRINRTPKRLWNKTFREIQQQDARQRNAVPSRPLIEAPIRVAKVRSPLRNNKLPAVTQMSPVIMSPNKPKMPPVKHYMSPVKERPEAPERPLSPSKLHGLPSFMSPTKTSRLNENTLSKSSSTESLKSTRQRKVRQKETIKETNERETNETNRCVSRAKAKPRSKTATTKRAKDKHTEPVRRNLRSRTAKATG